jgi:pimeloyl-ACP methyl ester carboxylesterase
MSIPVLSFEGQGPLVHFLHANGYPPQTYHAFLSLFSPDYRVIAAGLRPLWSGTNPQEVQNWHTFRDDLIHLLDRKRSADKRLLDRGGKGIGMGHSVGATATLMAAIRRPDLFRALVLIEPVIFPPLVCVFWDVIARLGLMEEIHPLIKRTLKRRVTFPDQSTMFENYRQKKVFQRISDPVLWDYVEGMTRETAEGEIQLAYSPAWEARIYATAALVDRSTWRQLPTVDIPTLLVRGVHTDTFWKGTARRMAARLPDARLETLADTGHLAPLEAPEKTYRVVQEFLDKYIFAT